MNTPILESAKRGFGLTGKMVIVGILIFLCWLASLLVWGVVSERQNRQAEAEAAIAEQWGRPQLLAGPVIAVPYNAPMLRNGDTTNAVYVGTTRKILYILPSKLDVVTTLEPEVRSRGIFSAPVYRAKVSLSGTFTPPNISELGVSGSSLLWNEAVLAVGISDTRSINAGADATFGGQKITFLPGSQFWSVGSMGIHAKVGSQVLSGAQDFAFTLDVAGSKGITYLPLGEDTSVSVAAPWASPSFAGAYLPDEETLENNSFNATWHVSSLGRSYPSTWTTDGPMSFTADTSTKYGLFGSPTSKTLSVYSATADQYGSAVAESAFGVNLFREVTFYTLVSRTVKYAILFIALTFLAFYLFEISARIKVHPFQYLLIGAALVLFYLLLLSFAEIVGFGWAYLGSTILTLGLVTWYSASVLGTGARANRIAAILAVLYAYLYAILQLEQYALLFGTLFLFIALAVVMRATRSIEWYSSAP